MLANFPDKVQNSVVKNYSTGISNENQLQGFENGKHPKGFKAEKYILGS